MNRGRLALVVLLGLAAVAGSLALSCALGAQHVSLSRALAGQEPDRAILVGLRLQRNHRNM